MRDPYHVWGACFDWVLANSLLRDETKPHYRDRLFEKLYLIVKMVKSQVEWSVAIEFDPDLPVKVIHLAEMLALAAEEGVISPEEWEVSKTLDFNFPREKERVFLN